MVDIEDVNIEALRLGWQLLGWRQKAERQTQLARSWEYLLQDEREYSRKLEVVVDKVIPFMEMYIRMVERGDCGSWDVNDRVMEPELWALKDAISELVGEGGAEDG